MRPSRRALRALLLAAAIGGASLTGGCVAPTAADTAPPTDAPDAATIGEDPAPAAPAPPVGDPAPPFGAFAVRGRLPEPVRLSWRLDASRSPVPLHVLARAFEDALAVWEDTGLVRFAPADEGAVADVTVSWHGTDAPEGCRPFGQDLSVAHSGPLGPGSFLHLDDERLWRADGSDHGPRVVAGDAAPEPLEVALVHELGHQLGLDHCTDPAAVMSPDARVSRPGPSDLAGLHSLYGGGTDGPGDLVLLRVLEDGGERPLELPVLRRVAPPGRSDHALFDTDGDGDDELLVWRTDPDGLGALVVYHFGPGPRLERTVGPVIGLAAFGVRPEPRRDGQGRRWLLTRPPAGAPAGIAPTWRRFDHLGLLQGVLAAPPAEAELLPAPTDPHRGDLDGDGLPEAVRRLTGSGHRW